MEIKLRIAIGILIVAMAPGWASATDLGALGEYRQVRATESGHCYGPEVKLWENDAGELLGVLTYFDGPCADAACSLVVGWRSDSKLSFSASERISGKSYSFKGAVKNRGLSGSLNNEHVELSPGSELENRSAAEWCSQWEKVERCAGVEEHCRNLHNQ